MGTRGNYAAGKFRIEQILDAATLHFAANGYHETTLASIAEDVGITTAGLMHHFPSKQNLLVTLADRRISLFGKWAEEEMTGDDGLGFWRATVEISRRMAAKPGLIDLFVIIAFSAADQKSPVHDLYKERYERTSSIGAEHFQQGIERGLFQPDIDCMAYSRQGIAMADGLQLQWALSHGGFDLAKATKVHHERVLSTIAMPGITIDLTPRPRKGSGK